MNAPKATVDFETRSACNLRNCGTWRYSVDPTTDILCLVFRLPTWAPGRTALWHPAFPSLDVEESDYDSIPELLEWIAAGKLVEAHGVWFEFCIWGNVLVPRYGWPEIAVEQWRCSAAKAAAHALPRALDDAGDAQHLDIIKDMEGSKVMKKMAKPRKSRKKEREGWAEEGVEEPEVLYHESAEQLETLWAYCRQDVLAEEALSEGLDDLNANETRMFHMDLRTNARGFQLDTKAVTSALQLISRETVLLNRELRTLTGDQVHKATQRAQMIEWLAGEECLLPNTQKDTIDEALKDPTLLATARAGLTIMRALGRSSTAKYQSMRNWADPSDGRVRGGLLYHGATTGRWSGKGVQPHNFPRGSVKDQEALWATLKAGVRADIQEGYNSVMEALSESLRGAIVPREGYQLYVADYASIEARVLLWVAGDDGALDVFRRHEDIYCDMAASIYNRPVTKADKDERQMGKQAILGLGYQMGWSKFQATCAKYGIMISDEFAQQVVNAYREKYWRVKALWNDIQQAAVDALHEDNDGIPVDCGMVEFCLEGRFLFCTLPSGRRLAYPEPRLSMRKTPWGSDQITLTYMGFNSLTHQWQRQTTYGGMLVENIVQAIARDLMAEAMLACEMHPYYSLVLSVHDELIAEAPLDKGDVKEFEALMAKTPRWAAGCPVEAEGWRGTRYRK